MEMKKSLFNKILSSFLVWAMVLTTVFAMPTMNAEAATKKAAMSKTSVTLIVNKTCTLSVNNAKGKATWSTSDKKVATVSKTGDRSAKITAKKTGTATITAKIGSKKYTCKVKVENPKLSATSKTLNTKDAKTATLQLNSTSQGSSVKWSTSNSKIVSIKASKNKVTMTAKKAGNATVTASVGGKKFRCKVTVEKSHNYKKGKIVAATCSKKGYTEYKCACGKSYKKTINATGKHSYTVKKNTVAATCTKDGYTVYKCKTCDKTTKKTIKATGHKYGEWEVTEPANSEHDGWETRKCQTCGETESREIHNWGEWEKTDPSCETGGSYSRVCTNCFEYESTPIPATGHFYGYVGEKDGYKWVEEAEEFDKDIEIQTTLYTCSVCGVSSTDQEIMEHHVDKHYDVADARLIESTTTETKHLVAKASGHYEKVECGVGGEKLYVCSQCGDTHTESISAPEAHEYGDGVETKPATCTEEEEMTYTCTVCGHKEVKNIPTLDHNYEAKTTTEVVETAENGDKITQTTTEKICSNCGEAEHEEHTWNGWVITKEPTTTEMGSKTRTCAECGATQTMDIARVAEPEHKEHTWSDWSVTEEATCTKAGSKTRTCTVCGEVDTQTIPVKEHDYETVTEQKKVVDKEAWDEEVKTTIYYCTGCGAEFNTSAELGKHIDDASDGKIDGHPNYGSMSSRVETKTIHHDEEYHYETITKHVCKTCGHVKED